MTTFDRRLLDFLFGATVPRRLTLCADRSPDGFFCTLKANHQGGHVARGVVTDEPMAAWPRSEGERP